MDYVSRRFLELATKLRDEVHIIAERLLFIRNDLATRHQEAAKSNQTGKRKRGPNPEVDVVIHTPEYVRIEERKARESQKKYQRHSLFATWAGVFVVAAYTTFAALQWCATRQASYQDQRPWVAGTRWNLAGELTENTDPSSVKVTIEIQNLGKTPALNVTGSGRIYLLPSDPQGALDAGDDPKTIRGILPQGVPTWLPFDAEPSLLDFTRDDILEYRHNHRKMYVQAKIGYCDTWNNFNWTLFCMHRAYGEDLTYFRSCEHGNSVHTKFNGCKNFEKEK